MNISTNTTCMFRGRREVMYALKMAASEAANTENYEKVSCSPLTIDKSIEAKISERAMNAYMEMAVYDDSFESVINNFPKNNELREILKPEDWHWSSTNPLKLFRGSLLNNLKKIGKPMDLPMLEEFFAKLKSMPVKKI